MTSVFANSLASAGYKTPIIDEEMLVIEGTEAQLGGNQPPITGAPYHLAAKQLGAIAGDMVAVAGAVPWEGPAGLIFAAQIKAYNGDVQKIATTDRVVALVIDEQAAAVLDARKALKKIDGELITARFQAQGYGVVGDFPKSAAVQSAAKAKAESDREAVLLELSGVTAGHAALVTELTADLGCVSEQLATRYTPATAGGNTVSVTPEELRTMAGGLSNCSKALAMQMSVPGIVAEVQATHGVHSSTHAFDLVLADFEETHAGLLAALQRGIDVRARNLDSTAGKYQARDDASADAFFGEMD